MNEQLESVAARYAVALRWLDDELTPLDGEIRANEMFPAASVIKVAVMACLLDQVEKGRLSLNTLVPVRQEDQVGGAGVLYEMEPREYTLGELCRLMMVVSDNTASNACLRAVGSESLRSFCESRGYQSRLEREFMSPVVNGRDNTMTAEAAARMLADLYRGQGLGPELREFAVGCLRRQQYREKIPLLLPPELLIGHKTGELEGVRHDAAVVETARPYVLVIFTAEGAEPWKVDRAMAGHSLTVYQRLRQPAESLS